MKGYSDMESLGLFEILDEHLNGGCLDKRCQSFSSEHITAATSSFIEHLAEEIMDLLDMDY